MKYWGVSAGLLTGALVLGAQMPDKIVEVSENEVYCSVDLNNPAETHLVDAETREPLSRTVKIDNVRTNGHTVIATDIDLQSKFSFYVDYTQKGYHEDGVPTCLQNQGQPEGFLYQVKYTAS